MNFNLSDLAKELEKDIENIQYYYAKAHVSLYYPDEHDLPLHAGTAILLNVKNYYFLVTASHVTSNRTGMMTRENKKEFFIPLKNQLYGLELNGFNSIINCYEHHILEHLSPENVEVDIAVFEIKEPSLQMIKEEYRFMDISEVQIDHFPSSSFLYYIYGFPEFANQVKESQNNKPNLFTISCKTYPIKDYNIIDAIPQTHIVVNLDKTNLKSPSGEISEIEPEGMSGGGLFAFRVTFSNNQVNVFWKLAGINIEYKDWADAFVCVKANYFTEIIRNKFPELKDKVPSSKSVKININS